MRNEGLTLTFWFMGGIIIVLGIIACLVLIDKFSEPGMFGNGGQLDGTEMGIVIGIAFYHLVIGMLCFGVAQALAEATQSGAMQGQSRSVIERLGEEKFGNQGLISTKCPKCNASYAGDLRGQFCESCGERLL
jgi:hypothetical protein